jgi:hypothetical protein
MPVVGEEEEEVAAELSSMHIPFIPGRNVVSLATPGKDDKGKSRASQVFHKHQKYGLLFTWAVRGSCKGWKFLFLNNLVFHKLNGSMIGAGVVNRSNKYAMLSMFLSHNIPCRTQFR